MILYDKLKKALYKKHEMEEKIRYKEQLDKQKIKLLEKKAEDKV